MSSFYQVLILGLEQWDLTLSLAREDLIYDWIINKVLIRKSMVLKVKDVIIKIKQIFDPDVIVKNSYKGENKFNLKYLN